MAKRKRLTPAQESYLDSENPELETKSFSLRLSGQPPIAHVAGEAAVASALQELSDEIKTAKEDGRMIMALPLDEIDTGYLVRDRMIADEDELHVLMQSLQSRGQQTPIEVVDLGPAAGQGRYGLISGWRRLTALRRLADDTGEARFGHVQALIRKPESAEAAYTAMVEENEIRVGLSYYERARIVAKAAEQGVFYTEKDALQELFHAASRAKRSKIKSFLALYHALDQDLQFAAHIPERLGMSLVKAMDANASVAQTARAALEASKPKNPEAEVEVLERVLQASPEKAVVSPILDTESIPKSESKSEKAGKGIDVAAVLEGDKVILTGADVTPAFLARIQAWLKRQ